LLFLILPLLNLLLLPLLLLTMLVIWTIKERQILFSTCSIYGNSFFSNDFSAYLVRACFRSFSVKYFFFRPLLSLMTCDAALHAWPNYCKVSRKFSSLLSGVFFKSIFMNSVWTYLQVSILSLEVLRLWLFLPVLSELMASLLVPKIWMKRNLFVLLLPVSEHTIEVKAELNIIYLSIFKEYHHHRHSKTYLKDDMSARFLDVIFIWH
jgi:hypothetical protein